jgi:hypothetical protein
MESDPSLENSTRDRIALAAKGVVGAIPFVGNLVAEIIGSIIPNQRVDRIARFLELLADKVRDIEEETLASKMRTEEFVDLFEDGMIQASRAVSEDRKRHLASLFKNAIANETLEHAYEKRLLQILGELNDVQILILRSYGMRFHERQEFESLHGNAIRGPRVFMSAPQKEIDGGAVHKSYRAHLVQLGLIKPVFERPKKDNLGIPEFDEETGMVKARSHQITTLGRLLLRYLDVPTD